MKTNTAEPTFELLLLPTPRRKIGRDEPVGCMVNPDTIIGRSSSEEACMAFRSSALTAVTAIGTACEDSERRCAVTVISASAAWLPWVSSSASAAALAQDDRTSSASLACQHVNVAR